MDQVPPRDRAQIGVGAVALACGVCLALGAGGVLLRKPCSEAEVHRRAQIMMDAHLEDAGRKWREALDEDTPYIEAGKDAAGGLLREWWVSEVQACLPCDRWPEGYTPQGGGLPGMELARRLFEADIANERPVLEASAGEYAVAWPDRSAVALVTMVAERDDLPMYLNPNSLVNKLACSDLSAGEMDVQGRTVKTLSFRAHDDLRRLRVDITGEKGPCALLEIALPGSLAELEETAVRFLEPFDLWRGE